jgi:hypothetical protein
LICPRKPLDPVNLHWRSLESQWVHKRREVEARIEVNRIEHKGAVGPWRNDPVCLIAVSVCRDEPLKQDAVIEPPLGELAV